jgi:hypothetical protein
MRHLRIGNREGTRLRRIKQFATRLISHCQQSRLAKRAIDVNRLVHRNDAVPWQDQHAAAGDFGRIDHGAGERRPRRGPPNHLVLPPATPETDEQKALTLAMLALCEGGDLFGD